MANSHSLRRPRSLRRPPRGFYRLYCFKMWLTSFRAGIVHSFSHLFCCSPIRRTFTQSHRKNDNFLVKHSSLVLRYNVLCTQFHTKNDDFLVTQNLIDNGSYDCTWLSQCFANPSILHKSSSTIFSKHWWRKTLDFKIKISQKQNGSKKMYWSRQYTSNDWCSKWSESGAKFYPIFRLLKLLGDNF